jgi:hypothetical protein
VGGALAYGIALAILKWLPLYDCVFLVLLVIAVFRALEFANERTRTLTLIAVSFILNASFLVRLWTLGYEGRNAVFGGILPWSDSSDFLSDALRLVHGQRFSPASSRRPLFIALLAGLLKLGGGHLRFALVWLTALGAISMSLPALEVWRTNGRRAALVVYVILLFFERRFTGFIQTEHLGLPLGAIGFVLLWRAQSANADTPGRAVRCALLGVFAISLGLLARAGCFFTLPAFAVWGARLAPPGRRVWLFGGFVVAGLAAFAIHEAVCFWCADGVTFSDYPPIFYGLLHGEDFTYIEQTHPFLGDLPVRGRPAAEWALIFSELRRAPWMAPLGLARSFVHFLASPSGAFSYVWTNPDDHIFENGPLIAGVWRAGGVWAILGYWRRALGAFSIVNAVAMGALASAFVVSFVVGGWRLLSLRKDPAFGLLTAATLGILLSVPFMPPWITSGVQVQTVTLAFAAALPAVLVVGETPARAAPNAPSSRPLAIALIDGIGAFALVLTWVLLRPEHPPRSSVSAAKMHWVRIDPSSEVEVASHRSLSVEKKGIEDLSTSMMFLSRHFADFTASLTPLEVGTRLHSAYDPEAGQWQILVDEMRLLGPNVDWVEVESAPRSNPRVQRLLAVAQHF